MSFESISSIDNENSDSQIREQGDGQQSEGKKNPQINNLRSEAFRKEDVQIQQELENMEKHASQFEIGDEVLYKQQIYRIMGLGSPHQFDEDDEVRGVEFLNKREGSPTKKHNLDGLVNLEREGPIYRDNVTTSIGAITKLTPELRELFKLPVEESKQTEELKQAVDNGDSKEKKDMALKKRIEDLRKNILN